MARRSLLPLLLITPLALAQPAPTPAAKPEPKPAAPQPASPQAPATPAPASPATPPAAAPEAPKGLAVGDVVPDGPILDAEGKPTTFSAVRGKGPCVVTFYRGGWCPYCTKALAGWEAKLPALREAGATLIAISLEKPEEVKKTGEKSMPSAAMYCDPTGDLARSFHLLFPLAPRTIESYRKFGVDLQQHNASAKWELPVPATFLVDGQGVVRWVHFDQDYKKRADIDQVIAAVKTLDKAPAPKAEPAKVEPPKTK